MPDIGYLVLENGNIYEGKSFGFQDDVYGEVVFNTGMTGYPESFTDPSYSGQILVCTYPLIGNYGVPTNKLINNIEQNFESYRIHISGLIISESINSNTHWQSKQNLSQWLIKNKIPALSNIDTRSLTKLLRQKGVMKGQILKKKPLNIQGLNFIDINESNLIDKVSTKKREEFGEGKIKVMVFDCGMKNNQINHFLKLGVKIIKVPWNYDPFEENDEADGYFISNGPGDPKMAVKTIQTIHKAYTAQKPIFGICLGHQILSLAVGANTYKLKYGHRSQNQPVICVTDGKCYITSQNHGFAVDNNSLPTGFLPWFTNLNDQTNEGIRHHRLPVYSVQFHPEANPGPVDTAWMFDKFIEDIKLYKNAL
jgi:carbamoyl-phosphate synthase small subunit